MNKKRTTIYDRIKITFLNGTVLQLPKPTDLSPKDLEKSLTHLEQNKLILSVESI